MAGMEDNTDAMDQAKFPLCEPCQQLEKKCNASMYCIICSEHLCDNCTSSHNVSKATKDHKTVTQNNAHKEIFPDFECDPCKCLSRSSIAANFCEKCEEYLCNRCHENHKAQKATRTHRTICIADHVSKTRQFCDICSTNIASNFCEICEETYCTSCSLVHTTQKATKNHIVINLCDRELSKPPSCDSCKYNNIDHASERYCHECDEHLCASCTSLHKTRKATRNHELSDAKTWKCDSHYSCDVCLLNKVKVDTHFICKQCEEKLCCHCRDIHLKQTATYNHELSKINYGKFELEISCDQCSNDKGNKCAVVYCEQCEDNLCIECTRIHKRLTTTSNHVLGFPNSKEMDEVCHPCKEDDNRIPAESYCAKCDENLCTTCTKIHQKQKATQLHQLYNIMIKQKLKRNCCAPCLSFNKNNRAVKFCTDCFENLCEECVNSHRRQKVYKHHLLLNALNQLNADKLCDPCKRLGESNQADVYCKSCDEYLCTACEIHHNAEKSTTAHTLVPSKESKVKPRDEDIMYCDVCTFNQIFTPATSFCVTCDEPQLFCNKCAMRHVNLKINNEHIITMEFDRLQGHVRQNDQPKDEKGVRSGSDSVESASMLAEDTSKDKVNKDLPGKPAAEIPGKPRASNIKADSLELSWEHPRNFAENDIYQVRYKDIESKGKWKCLPNEYTSSTVQVTDLKANTKFIFQVRKVHDDDEGPYSDSSDDILTLNSPGGRMVDFSKLIKCGNPSIYELPLTEVRNARFEKAKLRKFELGAPLHFCQTEKTIMLVGATGTGKTTLVDGFVNYILGVNWNDPYRFTIINMEDEERQRTSNQAVSQTEWITNYTIHPENGSRLEYKLNIIDTPGFGDTRGLHRDKKIVDQIRELFSAEDAKGVVVIDAVCFLIKAPDARLTATQKYIFHSIMSLFGQDIEKNICTLVTFADGQVPPVLSSLKHSKLPFGQYFTFNNSGLFSENTVLDSSSLSPMFWEMGVKSYRAFFDILARMETKSLALTKQVLDERQRLELTISSLQPQVNAGLAKITELKVEYNILDKYKADISDNKNFHYEVEETHQIQKELPEGLHVTNCLHCNITCHDNCIYANDEEKRGCLAIDAQTGTCRVCPVKCDWKQHKNTPYIFEYVKKKVKKTYQEKEKKYEDACGHRLNTEQVLEKMCEELQELQDGIEELMQVVNKSNNRLKEIALRPDPLSMVEHIDLMIESEKLEKKEGWQDRVYALMDCKGRAQIGKQVEKFNEAAKGTKWVRFSSASSKQRKEFHLPAFVRKWIPSKK